VTTRVPRYPVYDRHGGIVQVSVPPNDERTAPAATPIVAPAAQVRAITTAVDLLTRAAQVLRATTPMRGGDLDHFAHQIEQILSCDQGEGGMHPFAARLVAEPRDRRRRRP